MFDLLWIMAPSSNPNVIERQLLQSIKASQSINNSLNELTNLTNHYIISHGTTSTINSFLELGASAAQAIYVPPVVEGIGSAISSLVSESFNSTAESRTTELAQSLKTHIQTIVNDIDQSLYVLSSGLTGSEYYDLRAKLIDKIPKNLRDRFFDHLKTIGFNTQFGRDQKQMVLDCFESHFKYEFEVKKWLSKEQLKQDRITSIQDHFRNGIGRLSDILIVLSKSNDPDPNQADFERLGLLNFYDNNRKEHDFVLGLSNELALRSVSDPNDTFNHIEGLIGKTSLLTDTKSLPQEFGNIFSLINEELDIRGAVKSCINYSQGTIKTPDQLIESLAADIDYQKPVKVKKSTGKSKKSAQPNEGSSEETGSLTRKEVISAMNKAYPHYPNLIHRIDKLISGENTEPITAFKRSSRVIAEAQEIKARVSKLRRKYFPKNAISQSVQKSSTAVSYAVPQNSVSESSSQPTGSVSLANQLAALRMEDKNQGRTSSPTGYYPSGSRYQVTLGGTRR
jgi:hypothetical protein